MIPKSAYLLTCVDAAGKITTEYPTKEVHSENKQGWRTTTTEYLFDWNDVMQHISENVSKRYQKVIISKVFDIMHVSIESAYEEKK